MRAAVWSAYGGLEEPDCSKCRLPGRGELRAQWGCDAPSTVGGVYDITCPSCDGTGCSKCSHRGQKAMLRCPSALMDVKTGELLSAYGAYAEHGVFPVPGGRYEQTASFHHWCRIVSAERKVAEQKRFKSKR